MNKSNVEYLLDKENIISINTNTKFIESKSNQCHYQMLAKIYFMQFLWYLVSEFANCNLYFITLTLSYYHLFFTLLFVKSIKTQILHKLTLKTKKKLCIFFRPNPIEFKLGYLSIKIEDYENNKTLVLGIPYKFYNNAATLC